MQLLNQTPPWEESTPTFPLFPHLPTELRLKVWSAYLYLTLPSPISITISVSGTTQRWVADDSILRKGHPIPAILHVCQEAREEGLGKYILGYDLEGGLSELPFNHCWKRVEDTEI
jgi:2EXR family